MHLSGDIRALLGYVASLQCLQTAMHCPSVLQALRSWMAIAGQREWRCTVAGKPTVSWLNQLAGEKFWVNNRSKLVTAIAEGASVRACSQRVCVFACSL